MTIQELYKSALVAERETGIPALFVVAQAILESGWRITPIKNSNNIYGIKYSPEDPRCPYCRRWGYVYAPTSEFEGGVEYHKTLKFQQYSSVKDCIKHHTKMLTENIIGAKGKYTYKQCLEHYKKDYNLDKYVQCVALSYATDPYYAKKIMNIISSIKNTLIKNTLEVVKVNDKFKKEVEEAKETMVKYGIMKPSGPNYWTQERIEAAVRLFRFQEKLKITLEEGD